MDPSLLNHYEAELAFVRETGGEFAREFPKIAARLNLGSFDVADPYVERLFEGFALLAARIQLKLEAEFPTFTQSLLQMVYPHYLAPTPAMAVVQFRPEASLRGVPQGVTLPPGTELRSLLGTEDQTNCEFRTAHPVQLLPIELAEAEYIASPAALTALGLPEQPGVKAAIRLRLRATGEAPFARLALERLPLFLAGPEGARARLYEQLVANLTAVYVRPARAAAALAGAAAGRRGAPARVRARGGAAAAHARIVRGLPAAAGVLRHAGALPVRGTRRARSRGFALRWARSWRSSCCSTAASRCSRPRSVPIIWGCSARRRSTCFPGAPTASTSMGARPSTTSCPTACARSTSRCSA